MNFKSHIALISLFTLLIAGSAAAADRRVPSEYPTLQAAIDDSQDGDRILLASGEHAGPAVVTGLDLRIEAESGRPRIVNSTSLTVRVSDGSTVEFAGLDIWGGSTALYTINDSISILNDCVVQGNGVQTGLLNGGWGATVSVDSTLEATNSVIRGGDAADFTSIRRSAGRGLWVQPLSGLRLLGCLVQGGNGGDQLPHSPAFGGSDGQYGLIVHGARVFLEDSVIRGGDGGDDFGGHHASHGGYAWAAFSASRCLGQVISCEFAGGRSRDSPRSVVWSGDAISATNSRLELIECRLVGGDLGSGSPSFSTGPGDALKIFGRTQIYDEQSLAIPGAGPQGSGQALRRDSTSRLTFDGQRIRDYLSQMATFTSLEATSADPTVDGWVTEDDAILMDQLAAEARAAAQGEF